MIATYAGKANASVTVVTSLKGGSATRPEDGRGCARRHGHHWLQQVASPRLLRGSDLNFKQPYQRHCERSEAIHSFFAWRHGLLRYALMHKRSAFVADNDVETVSHSRGAMHPSFALELPALSNQRAQGMPDARCTRGLVCE
ncbi:hypothetical protein [Bradyrhizobium sp. JYMT SZCCT0180]|uniref:hypothetical protein n=1 Tax=Bradyrhizobium sp. JYMT SZCCT0180 TaxID=2807666 RepID=UPI001BA46C3D|nr:hypothetical protein [Bradyrhizobium sp. JYMT SZCCT0180]MBR1216234.1 hypothetical protein [Bradyrhizobium sp. JYMT SZCCT0180]